MAAGIRGSLLLMLALALSSPRTADPAAVWVTGPHDLATGGPVSVSTVFGRAFELEQPDNDAEPELRLSGDMERQLDFILSERIFKAVAAHGREEGFDYEAALMLLRHGKIFTVRGGQRNGRSWAMALAHITGLNKSNLPEDQLITRWLGSVAALFRRMPPARMHPLLRRMAVALLLRARVRMGKQWSEEMDRLGRQLLLQLYSLHRASAAGKSAMEFYHVSKAGGTSFCITAEDVGCRTQSTRGGVTCLIQAFNDGPRWIDLAAHRARCAKLARPFKGCEDMVYKQLARWGNRYVAKYNNYSCPEREELLGAKGWNFYASEYTLRQAGQAPGEGPLALCGRFFNVMLLREPISRLMSHLGFLVKSYVDKMGDEAGQFMAGLSLEGWSKLAPAVMDNYYARMLLGEQAFYAPRGALQANASVLVHEARALLGSFDMLLVLEHGADVHGLGQLWGLGWRHSMFLVGARNASELDQRTQQLMDKTMPGASQLKTLRQANQLDTQLYEFANMLAHLDAAVWAAADGLGGDPLAGLAPPGTSNGIGRRRATLRSSGGSRRSAAAADADGGVGAPDPGVDLRAVRAAVAAGNVTLRCGYVAPPRSTAVPKGKPKPKGFLRAMRQRWATV